jgi:hypothetical protein
VAPGDKPDTTALNVVRFHVTGKADDAGAVATVTGKGIEALSLFGRYVAAVFGGVADLHQEASVNAQRARNMEQLAQEAGLLFAAIEPERLSAPSPSVMIPLIVAAADEERGELTDLWAKLLANAAIDKGRKVRREFFDVVKQLEPIDAALFCGISDASVPRDTAGIEGRTIKQFVQERNTSLSDETTWDVSMDALERLRLVVRPSGERMISPFGRALLAALKVS